MLSNFTSFNVQYSLPFTLATSDFSGIKNVIKITVLDKQFNLIFIFNEEN